MGGLADAYLKDNPNTTNNVALPNNQVQGNKLTGLQSAYSQDSQASQLVSNQDQVQGGDYLGAAKSAGIGAVKGAASVLDTFLTPTVLGISSVLPGKTSPEASFSGTADKYLPEPSNKPAANIAQGVV